MKGYEIIINYLMAKIQYDSYQKFGDANREGSQMILDLISLKERGMQDIKVELYRKVQGADFKEDNDGMPFGILNVLNVDKDNEMHIVHYVNMNTNTLYCKTIKPSLYHEYMTELCKNREQFVSPYPQYIGEEQ